ncbi:hypothetical protein CFC21_017518 [Triticum aestivum]|uniref:FK506-binding protein n=2 Tax=Triticum aestivum TaxID=4565 RepID=A0A9R1E2L1_WHEAT|nr:hypothetical protein CFC21_017518 [Triticum aestivum]
MSSFWGAEVKPEKPYTHTHSPRRGRLRLTQATLGAEVGKVEKGKTDLVQLQCTVKNKEPVYLCALIPGQSVTCHLDLEFEEKFVTFSVLGLRSVHLAGYYVGDVYEDIGDSDTGSESLQGSDDDFMASDDDDVVIPVSHGQMNTDSEDDSDYDEDYDSEDDEDLIYNQGRGKSSVVIEEIQDDEKPVDDNSRLQLAVRTPPAESVESEDEDGFPVSESKKSSKGSSKKAKNLNNGTSTEDRKRKSDAINDPHKSLGEVNAENDVVSKKKKKDKKEVKLASSADTVAAKQKKKKSKKQSTSEGDTDKQADKRTITDNDEEPSKQGAKKKKNKKKTKENNGSENQTVALGKPDGKKATPGKKVFVTYTGKLKNGKIFDSNVGRKPFAFRLGIGQVIKGWDIGVNGMRIGDKRKLTIPPSMGYGNQKAGEIPPNSTLLFDVELMNVH